MKSHSIVDLHCFKNSCALTYLMRSSRGLLASWHWLIQVLWIRMMWVTVGIKKGFQQNCSRICRTLQLAVSELFNTGARDIKRHICVHICDPCWSLCSVLVILLLLIDLTDAIYNVCLLQNCSVGIVGKDTPFTIYDDDPVERYVSFIALHISVVVLNVNPLPHGDANRHTIFKRKN